ncbi:MAG: hypothetical protein ACRC6U_09110 [Fusobacteriaceae bacterium]
MQSLDKEIILVRMRINKRIRIIKKRGTGDALVTSIKKLEIYLKELEEIKGYNEFVDLYNNQMEESKNGK